MDPQCSILNFGSGFPDSADLGLREFIANLYLECQKLLSGVEARFLSAMIGIWHVQCLTV